MFKITVDMKTPIILSPDAHLTLDGVLHHALTEKYNGDSARAMTEIPLEKKGSVFAASAAFFPLSAHYDSVSRVGDLKGESDAGTHLFAPNDRKKGWRPFRTTKDKDGVKALLHKYQAISTPYLFWFANGDHLVINELLSGLIGLGKRYTSGNGQMGSITFEMSDDYSIVLPDGTPARPVPIEEWEGDTSGLRQETVACLPPYFQTVRRHCVLHTKRFIEV